MYERQKTPYVHYAIVRDLCPFCSQGAIYVAARKDDGTLFVICEECESESSSPTEIFGPDLADWENPRPSRYVAVDELIDHPWYTFVLNKGV